jgi:hypothetical protein
MVYDWTIIISTCAYRLALDRFQTGGLKLQDCPSLSLELNVWRLRLFFYFFIWTVFPLKYNCISLALLQFHCSILRFYFLSISRSGAQPVPE